MFLEQLSFNLASLYVSLNFYTTGSFNVVFPPSLPFSEPQICRLHPWDAEADSGADAGRSLTVLDMVYAHLFEHNYPPPGYCR